MSEKVNDPGWLQDHIRLTQWDIEQPYKQHDLSPIHSLAIDNNQKFIQLKHILQSYNNEVQSLNKNKDGIIHGGVKWHFAATLYAMLHDITQTKDLDVQKRYLQDVYEWASNYEFNRKVRPLTATTRPDTAITAFTRPATGKTLTNMRRKLLDMKSQDLQMSQIHDEMEEKGTYENIMVEHKKSTATEKILPGDMTKQMRDIKDQMRDYKYQHRTSYSEIDLPGERLKQYPRRKRLDLQLQKPKVPIKIHKQQRITTEEVFKQINKTEQQVDIMNIDPEGDEGQQLGEREQQVEIPEIDFGGQVDEEQEPEEPQEEDTVDKLAPKTKVFKDFEVQVHDNTVEVSRNRNFRKKNNELKGIINDVESTEMMQQDWVRAKSRWRNQQFRKQQASKIVRSASATMEENFPQNMIDMTKIKNRPASSTKRSFLKNTEKDHRQLIVRNNLQNQLKNIALNDYQPLAKTEDPQKTQSKPRCLSAFVPSGARKVEFSDILLKGRQKLFSQLDSELIGMKERLAAHRIPIDISKLRSGISLEGNQMKMMYEESTLPGISGGLLLHNPYFKVGKKKKKKKKKK